MLQDQAVALSTQMADLCHSFAMANEATVSGEAYDIKVMIMLAQFMAVNSGEPHAIFEIMQIAKPTDGFLWLIATAFMIGCLSQHGGEELARFLDLKAQFVQIMGDIQTANAGGDMLRGLLDGLDTD